MNEAQSSESPQRRGSWWGSSLHRSEDPAGGPAPAGSSPDSAGASRADRFADVLAANEEYAAHFSSHGMTGRAARGLAIVTCMDSRIDPLAVVGMKAGDVKILRNAGARVTNDVLRTLVLAAYLLDVDRVLLMPHTRCKMASATEEEIHATILKDFGVETHSIEFRTVTDQSAALRRDLRRIRDYPFLPKDLAVAGGLYDVDSGKLTLIDG